MPSFRAHLLNSVLRIAVKRRLRRQRIEPQTIARSRARLDRLGSRTTLVPQLNRSRETLADVPVEWTRAVAPEIGAGPIIFYCHGGAYLTGSPKAYRGLMQRLALACTADVVAIRYRLAPEAPFPAAPEDAISAYRGLLASGVASRRIVIAGDSAGGNLALATLLRARDAGLPPPAAAVLYSPWTDLTGSGASVVSNRSADPMLPAERLAEAAAAYVGANPPDNPQISPLFAHLGGLPPLSVHVGSTEILLDDARRLVERVQRAGGQAELRTWRALPHSFPAFADVLPEARLAIAETADFVTRATGSSFQGPIRSRPASRAGNA